MKIGLTGQILVGLLAGLAVGLAFGTTVAPLGELGKLYVSLIKLFALPLLAFSIGHSVISTQWPRGTVRRLLLITTSNAIVALTIGLLISNIVHPGQFLAKGLTSPTQTNTEFNQSLDFVATLNQIIPSNFVDPVKNNNVLPIIVLVLLFCFAAKRSAQKDFLKYLSVLVEGLASVFQKILEWLIVVAPLAVFGIVASTVGKYGLAPAQGLAVYLLCALAGLSLHVVLCYGVWIGLIARIPISHFFSQAKQSLVYAFGSNSSLATLPLTLKALDGLKVSRQSSTLGACIGTNLNNDGIILYEAMAVIFIAQLHGIELSVGAQIKASILSLLAAMGVAGVPEAGIISLSLVLTTVGLPTEYLPLLLTVDWIVARARSVVNVLSDMVVSIGLDQTR